MHFCLLALNFVNFYPIFKNKKSKSRFIHPLSEYENISLIQRKAIFWPFVKQSAFLLGHPVFNGHHDKDTLTHAKVIFLYDAISKISVLFRALHQVTEICYLGLCSMEKKLPTYVTVHFSVILYVAKITHFV